MGVDLLFRQKAAWARLKGTSPADTFPRTIAKQGVDMLRRLPDAKCILARSLFYLSTYEGEPGQHYMDEALELFCMHHGVETETVHTPLTSQDFDNLLVHYYR